MKKLLNTKSFWVSIVSIVAGVVLIIASPENKEIGVAVIMSGIGTITLRDAIGKK